MRQRTRLVAGAMVAAAMCTVLGTAAASASPTAAPSTSASATVGATAPGPGQKKGGGISQAELAKVAASLHVSVKRLTTALQNMKKAIGQGTSPSDALAAFAKELGVSVAQVKAALVELGGGAKAGKPGPGDQAEAARILAGELHVSVDRARQVLTEIQRLHPASHDVTTDPGFVRIARGLGITPQQLAADLVQMKEKLAGSAPAKAPTK